jgi:hypothetical protein
VEPLLFLLLWFVDTFVGILLHHLVLCLLILLRVRDRLCPLVADLNLEVCLRRDNGPDGREDKQRHGG